ncbi:polysaccharide deacetylase family protein [Bacillus sp. ISL-47]|uniref:polysaccharide deacetylase family protein n=1 Tax=Bacillus sp. ISL-47 TaxID=2819130 RepID=UPI001BED21D5|nr:polysaccharide deacetylase family protein [Bacillus sp. ISL-47]MBT2688607.1 polysaccharide deacetylase family protein [Bacillus sp. ISL-47]MBT2708905.1 polysaccharide deacetylase family protein [Pseudomonas sp. ISL-84]
MRKFIHIGIMFVIAFVFVNNPLTDQYVAGLKENSGAVTVSKPQDSLYDDIEAKAAEYSIPAQDAKIDPVWKAIPGYNGIEVDVKASYKKMKAGKKFNEEKLVFKQVEPKVKLSDLPPAPVYKGHPDKPMVSFIINVAWGNEYLSGMLATLKRHNVSASFFLEGRWVKNNPELARLIMDAGHEVGNHSYTHPDMKVISSAKAREEIQKTNDVIEATMAENTRKQITWFAPPSGSYRDEIVKIAAQENLGTVMWTVDTVDWKKPSPEQLINRVLSKVHNGALILMHPTDSTEKSLDQLIMGLKQKNLQIGTVSELLSENRIQNRENNNQGFGKNNNNDIN